MILDSIFRNGSKLSIQLDTSDQNIIVTTSNQINQNYIRILKDEQITITCTKKDSYVNGSLNAFINTKMIQPSSCLAYLTGSDDDNNCLSEEFNFKLERDRSSYYEIWCKFVSIAYNEISSLFLFRLCMSKFQFIF